MKRIIGLVLSLVILMGMTGVAGCGKVNNNESSKYELTIGYDKGGYGDEWLKSLVDSFCEMKGIERDKVLIVAEKGYTETISSKLETNTSILDVMITEESTQRQWAARGQLEPLDDVFEMTISTGEKIEDILVEGYKEIGYVDNINGKHYYLFPFTQSSGGLFYNKTLFTEKGWTVPTTFEELEKLCKKIYNEEVMDQPEKDKQIYPFVCSADIVQYWDFVVQNWWVQSMGIDAFKEFCKFESAELFNPEGVQGKAKIEALNAFAELALKDKETQGPRDWIINNSADYTAAQMLFVQGKAAMMPNGSWIESEMSASMPEGMEIALMPTPFLANAKKDADGNPIRVNFNCSANSILVPKSAAHKELAKEFIVYMCEPAMFKDFVSKTGTPRPLKINIDDVQGLTTCQQSVVDAWKNSVNFAFMTTSPLSGISQAAVWKRGFPYGLMVFPDNEGKLVSAEEYVRSEYQFCKAEWNNWLEDATR